IHELVTRSESGHGTLQDIDLRRQVWKAMHLLSLPKLEPMLQMPKKRVCRSQLVEIVTADMPFVVKFVQGKQCAAGAKPWLRSSVYALQALHQDLYVPDSAAIYLNVSRLMAFHRDLASTLLVNLLASHKRSFDGGEVDLLAVNLRLNPADELAR